MPARGLDMGRRCAKAFVAAALTAVTLAGCAGNGTNTFNVDRGDSLSIDAGQRVVLVTHKGGTTGDRQVVCAEPSPDAAVARSFVTSAEAAVTPSGAQSASGSAKSAASSTESVSALGTRTQTIQLLRDGLFRACEAFMNGAIDQVQYNAILLNIDRVMITALGIDAIGALPAGSGAAADTAATTRAEAVANIVQAVDARPSEPDQCLTLMASGHLRMDNPGQLATLRRCDALLAATFDRLVKHPQRPVSSYRMTPPAELESAPAPATSSLEGMPPDPAPQSGWATHTASGQKTATVAPADWTAAVELQTVDQ